MVGTLHFREIPGMQFGSAFFPRILGAALILTGLALIGTAAKGTLIRLSDMVKGRAGLQVLAVLVGVVAWVLVSPLLGFMAATALLISSLALLGGGRPLPSIGTGTGIGIAIFLFIFFGKLLRVPLPFGVFEGLLS